MLFMQNLFLLHQQLGVVLVTRIRLLWNLELFIQMRRRCYCRGFHLFWIFPRPAEFFVKSISTGAIFLRPCSEEICEWVESHSTMYWGFRADSSSSIKIAGSPFSHRHVRFIIHMLQELLTQWQMDVKEKRIFTPDKICTASKAGRRNLWSFVALAKILVGANNPFH